MPRYIFSFLFYYFFFFFILCYVFFRPHIPATNAVRLSADF